MAKGKVIWITGLSGAGKTTLSRQLAERLRAMGLAAVVLDGDEIRAVLGDKWGYTPTDRHELAFVYGRLAKLIAASGTDVICATIAMFDDIRAWNRENIENYYEVFLRAPLDVLIARDTKGLYKKYLNSESPESILSRDFQFPIAPDLVIDNFGAISPADAVHNILEKIFLNSASKRELPTREVNEVRAGIIEHWNNYYVNHPVPDEPSSFAHFCKSQYIRDKGLVVEIGCGNGRDAFFFACTNPVVAIDASPTAISNNEARARQLGLQHLTFNVGFFGEFVPVLSEPATYVYSRFVLHAMDEVYEHSLIRAAYSIMKPKALFLAEFRTIHDPLANAGVRIGRNERVTDHYRRFIDPAEVCNMLTNTGFEILYFVESKGLAVHKEEDPIVARVVARK
jgi:adenylylsulfate kinase